MKQFIALMMLISVLASCGTETALTPETETDQVIEQTDQDIDTELGQTQSVDEDDYTEAEQEAYEEAQDNTEVAVLEESEFEVKKVQAIYRNPAQEVFVDMEYVLDDEDNISEIQVIDTNYKKEENIPQLTEALQVLV